MSAMTEHDPVMAGPHPRPTPGVPHGLCGRQGARGSITPWWATLTSIPVSRLP